MKNNKKMILSLPSIKPKNTTINDLINCKGGAHIQSKKKSRQINRKNILKNINEHYNDKKEDYE